MKTGAEGAIIAGKYVLERELGHGGQSTVWAARDRVLDRPTAIKLMSPLLVESPDARKRFEREAKAAARISSPHVVQIFDFGIDDECPYIAMELLRGEDLASWLEKHGRLSLAETSSLIGRIARALEVVHAENVVHRDLKPANIFLAQQGGETVLKLVDFGIAKTLPREGPDIATSTRAIMGTVYYMSPEQIRLEKIDRRSDLWSLGVIAFEALTGHLPFSGENAFDIMKQICESAPPSARTYVPDLPAGIDPFFGHVWQQEPQRRPHSASEFARLFEQVAKPPQPQAPRSSKVGWLALVGAVVLLTVIASAVWLKVPDKPSGSGGIVPAIADSSASSRPAPPQTRRCTLRPWDRQVRAFGKVAYADCQKPDALHGYFLRVAWNKNEAAGRAAVNQAWVDYVTTDLADAPCPVARELVFFTREGTAGAGIYFPTKPLGWEAVTARRPDWLLQDAKNQPMVGEVCFFRAEEERIPPEWSDTGSP